MQDLLFIKAVCIENEYTSHGNFLIKNYNNIIEFTLRSFNPLTFLLFGHFDPMSLKPGPHYDISISIMSLMS